MAVPKKKSSKTRTNRRYRTWVKKEQKRLVNSLVLVPYGRGGELKPAHIYLDDGGDLRKHRKAAVKAQDLAPQPKVAESKAKKPTKKSPVKTETSKKEPARELDPAPRQIKPNR